MTTTTRERPVILTPAELAAALAGTLGVIERPIFRDGRDGDHMPWRVGGTHWQDGDASLRCPYGEPGTVLRVRETWGKKEYREYDPDGVYSMTTGEFETVYRADGRGEPSSGWRSASTLPRWAARLFLKNLAVSVVRVGGEWRWRVEVRRVDGDGRPSP